MTEKLYYQDSHLAEFTARVLTCTKAKNGWAVTLDRTAFFPEGGGQRPDTGIIGEAHVSDVQEKNGEILHTADRELIPGTEYACRIDWEQRYRRMQNHSGEHVMSGLIHQRFGFDNVGFHMGDDCMTIDFSGEISWDELMELEQAANEVIRKNLTFHIWFPDAEELHALVYRSKLELTHDVRIVEIPGVDICACCAPHVNQTGEIGMIKVLDAMRHRGGVRISLVCGMDALDTFRMYQKNITAVSNALSAKRLETGTAVERILAEKAALSERAGALSAELAVLRAESYPETDGSICVFDNILSESGRRELVNRLMPKCRAAAVFSGTDGAGYRYIIGSRSIDLRQNAKVINAAISGRGGGSTEMIQGSASAEAETIRKVIENL